ncbi:DUF6096 family protein [Roseburia inulinivorans]|uniref:DUF6096 family protein n=1 Tax=Roseburia inulinivorans TaxID=360807 RepID=UPI0032C19A1D
MEFINNDQYEDDKKEMDQDEKVVSMDEKKNMRPQFAYWEIDENTKLKLKITTEQTLELEKKYRRNLIGMIGDEDNIPPLTTMLQVVHAAAVPWQHGIKLKDIISLYKKYQEKGGTQLNFYVDVYIQTFMVSGFFSSSMVEDVSDGMKKIQENM